MYVIGEVYSLDMNSRVRQSPLLTYDSLLISDDVTKFSTFGRKTIFIYIVK